MAPLSVDPAALDGAGSALIDIGTDIGLTLSTLTGSLSGCASMCGNDPVGEDVGMAYDKSADVLVKGIAGARNGLVNLADGVRVSARNYSVAEAQSDVSGRAQALPTPASTGKISASSTSSSVGVGDDAPPGWGWVAKYIGMIWPTGDSVRLRAAAAAWTAAGTELMVTETSAAGPLGIVGAQQIPEVEVIGQAFQTSITAAAQIMVQTTKIAGGLTSYAANIDATHAAILDLLSKICDPMTGFKMVWDFLTDDDENEIKQIADDIKTVVDNFAAQASALASDIAVAAGAAETVVAAMAEYADKEWDQFLPGTDVGRVLNQVGQYGKGAWLEGGGMLKDLAVDAWKRSPFRLAVDPVGSVEDVIGQFEEMAPLVGLGGESAPGVGDVWKQLGKDTVHWDLWGKNPAEAAGRSVVDVVSVIVPGGAAGKASRATHALEDVGEHLPAALDNATGHVPDPVLPPGRPAPVPGAPLRDRPVSPPPPAVHKPAEAPASPRSGEPASAPVGTPKSAGPTESRTPAGPATTAAPGAGGRAIGEPDTAPSGGHLSPSGHGGPAASAPPAAAAHEPAPAGIGSHGPDPAGHDGPGADHGDHVNHGDHDTLDDDPSHIPPLLTRDTPYETGGIQPDFVGEQYPDGPFKFTGSAGVTYLDETAREAFRITIRDGLVYDAKGGLFDTSDGVSAFGHTSDGRAIFVMDEHGNLYASLEHDVGSFHHSSFFSGYDVAAAGELVVNDGRIEMLTDHSGHYQPGRSQTQQLLDQLASQGISIDPWDVDYSAPPGT